MEKVIKEANQVIEVSSVDQFKNLTSGMLSRIGSAMLAENGYYAAVSAGKKTVWVLK